MDQKITNSRDPPTRKGNLVATRVADYEFISSQFLIAIAFSPHALLPRHSNYSTLELLFKVLELNGNAHILLFDALIPAMWQCRFLLALQVCMHKLTSQNPKGLYRVDPLGQTAKTRQNMNAIYDTGGP